MTTCPKQQAQDTKSKDGKRENNVRLCSCPECMEAVKLVAMDLAIKQASVISQAARP